MLQDIIVLLTVPAANARNAIKMKLKIPATGLLVRLPKIAPTAVQASQPPQAAARACAQSVNLRRFVLIQLRLQVVLHSAKMLVRNPVQEMVLPIILLADHRNVLVGKFVVMEAVATVLVMMVRIVQKIRVLLLHVHVVRHLVVFSLHVVHMISIIKMLSPLEILQFSEETA